MYTCMGLGCVINNARVCVVTKVNVLYLQQRNRDLIAQVEQYARTNDHLTRQLNDTVRLGLVCACLMAYLCH
jgi:hypothetical protein